MLEIESLNPDKRLSVTIAIFFAEDALPVFEKQYPEDMRPKKAIEAAKAWLINPCGKIAAASNAAASNAAASNAAAYNAAAYNASAAAAAAASAASYAAYAASAAHNASYTDYAAAAAAAADAAFAAADAASAAVLRAADTLCYADFYIHRKLVQLLPHIFEYKLHAKTSFKDPEKAFNLLSEKNQQRFLFNLNHLR